MLNEFKDYLLHGKAIDLAIAVILAVAFGDVIRSLVSNLLSPFLGLAGSLGVGDLKLVVKEVEIPYGVFLDDLMGFIMVALAVFFAVVRPLLAQRARVAPPPKDTKVCPECLSTLPAAARRCAFCTAVQQADDPADLVEETPTPEPQALATPTLDVTAEPVSQGSCAPASARRKAPRR